MWSTRHLPNVLSISRIALSWLLLFFFRNEPVFLGLYLLTGLTDVLDGFIARRYQATSPMRARLDSAGDVCLYLVLTLYLATEHATVLLPFLGWVVMIATWRVVNVLTGWIKYRQLVMIHTPGNKLSGLLVFSLPLVADRDVVINATSVGLFPHINDRLDIDFDSLNPNMVVADGIHNPPLTHF